MADNTIRLTATWRTEFGKGAARRTRAAGLIPAVLYGHKSDTQHLSLPAHDFANAIRGDANRVLSLDIDGEERLALPRVIVRHPTRDYYQHVDLITVRRGEKVTVDITVHLIDEAAPGTLVLQEESTISVEVDALNIPEFVEVSLAGKDAGETIVASDIELPAGSELMTEPDMVVVAIQAAPTAEETEAQDEVAIDAGAADASADEA